MKTLTSTASIFEYNFGICRCCPDGYFEEGCGYSSTILVYVGAVRMGILKRVVDSRVQFWYMSVLSGWVF